MSILYAIGPGIRELLRATPMPYPMRWIDDFDYNGITFAFGPHVRRIPKELVMGADGPSQVFDEVERLLQDIKYTIATYEY